MAIGKQNMINLNEEINKVREEAAFSDGAEQAFKAIVAIYRMDDKTRRILFGHKGIMALVEEKPEDIFKILNNADEILANYVEVGDVVAKDADDSFRDVVTFVYENGTFDAISISEKRYGQVAKCLNMHDNHYHKTGEHIDVYNFKKREAYSWE